MNTKELLFVTGNTNKITEAGMYLPWYFVRGAKIDVPEIQSVDVIKVVKAKLQSAFQQTQQPCFVMDASLVIDGICKQEGGNPKQFPWALIKDVFSSMWDHNITKLVNLNGNTRCLWRSVLGYHTGKGEYYFEADLEWSIANTPRGTNGYDWDTIFIPKWDNRTFAEMQPQEKQSYALTKELYKKFREFLDEDN